MASDFERLELHALLERLAAEPELGFNAHQRVEHYAFGDPEWFIAVDEEARRLGVPEGTALPRYPAFRNFVGREADIYRYRKFVGAAAANAEHAKQMVVLNGPTSTGKSTFVLTMYGRVEGAPIPMLDPFRDGSGCPNRDNVFWMVPRSKRTAIAARYGITIKRWADICMICREAFLHSDPQLQEYPLKDPVNPDRERWLHFPTVIRKIGMREGDMGIGYGAMFPAGTFTADEQTLIGRLNVAELDEYPEGHIKTLLFNGKIHAAQGGIFELKEVYKIFEHEEMADKITFATQEGIIDGPGKYGQVSVDLHIVGHSNPPDAEAFRERGRAYVQISSRTEELPWRHHLSVTYEAGVYASELYRTDFIRDDHFAPDLLEITAYHACGTRIDKNGSEKRIKRKVTDQQLIEEYDGRRPDRGYSQNIKECREDGMHGFDPRKYTKAIGRAFAADEVDIAVHDGKVVATPIPPGERCSIWPEVRAEIEWDIWHDPLPNDEFGRYMGLLNMCDQVYERRLRDKVLNMLFTAPTITVRAEIFFSDYVRDAEQWLFTSSQSDEESAARALALEDELKRREQYMGITSTQDADAVRLAVVEVRRDAKAEGRALDWRVDPTIADHIQRYMIWLATEGGVALSGDFAEQLVERFGYCSRCAQKTLAYIEGRKKDILRR